MSDTAIIIMTAIICMTVAIVVATVCKSEKDNLCDGNYVNREEYSALLELVKDLHDYVTNKQAQTIVTLSEDIKQLRQQEIKQIHRDLNITNEKVHRLWTLMPDEEDKS